MCGIVGKKSFQRSFKKSSELPLIEKSLDKLHHQGPDDKEYFIDENVWLGATRPKIIDLSLTGHQPMQMIMNKIVLQILLHRVDIYSTIVLL